MALGQRQAVPDGRSPDGKRLRQVAETAPGGAPGSLSTVKLTTAVLQLQPERKNTLDAVHWNCDLLNAVITRVNTLEAWTNLAEPRFSGYDGSLVEVRDWIDSTTPKLFELDGFEHAVEKAIAKANEVAAHADGRLRIEIGQVTVLIDQAIGETIAHLDEIAAGPSALETTTCAMPAAAAAA